MALLDPTDANASPRAGDGDGAAALAVAGADGRIESVDAAWIALARAAGREAHLCRGADVREALPTLVGLGAEGAAHLAREIDEVLSGARGWLRQEYSFGSARAGGRCLVRLTRLPDREPDRFLATLEPLPASVTVSWDQTVYAALARASMDGIVIVGPGGRILEANDGYCTMLGYSRAELLTMHVADLDRADGPEGSAGRLRQTAEQGWGRFESRHTRSDGSLVDVEVTALYLAPQQRFLAIVSDIGTRKRTQEELQAREARYRLLVDHTSDLIWTLDSDGTFTYASPSWRRVTGYAPEEIVGRRFHPLVHPDDLPHCIGFLNAMIGAREALPGPEYRVRHADGSWHWHSAAGAPVLDDEGRFVSMVGTSRDVTERREAEERLRVNRERLALAADAAAIGVFDLDLRTGRLSWDEWMARIYGIALEQFTGDLEGWRQRVHPDDLPGAALDLDLAAAGEREFNRRFRVVRPDGATRHIRAFAKVIRAPDGSAERMVGVNYDITDRVEAEEALRKSRESYHAFIAQSHEAIYCTELTEPIDTSLPVEEQVDLLLDRSYLGECNQAMADLHGVPSPASLVGQRHPELPGGTDTGPRRARMREFIEAGYRTVDREAQELRPTGEARWIRTNAIGIVEDGRLLRVWGTTIDITDRKRTEESLAEERLLMQTLLDNLPGIFYLYSYPELRLVRWNRNHETLLGFDPGEIRDRSIMDWHVPEAKEAVAEAVEVAMARGQNSVEAPLVAKDGSLIPFLMTGVRVEAAGRLYLLGVGLDVRERLRAEEERARLEAQLRQTQRLESLGVLAGGVAHDFNNILAGVGGFVEIALDDLGDDSPTAPHLRSALAGVTRATELVRQILAFSRRAPMDRRPIHLHKLVADVLRFARATLPATVEIREALDPHVPPVQADPTQLHQVVLNLCTNAEHAMRPKGGVLELGLETREIGDEEALASGLPGPGTYAVLRVSDTGCGIDDATRERLFEPFFTTKPIGEGSGMGLATSHGIIGRHGGAIMVESTPGVGSTFRVFLPVTRLEAEAPAPVRTAPPTGSGRVLVIDDEEAILSAAETRLRSLGYEPTAVSSSHEALERFRSDPTAFVAIVTDQTMPRMTGLDLAAEVRRINATVPIVMATGFSPLVTPEALGAVGIREVLAKPYSRDQLATALRRATEARPDPA